MLEKNGLVKLSEECGELVQVSCKKMTCMNGRFHYDGSDLHARLEEEIGDVLAAIELVVENFGLDRHKINIRRRDKIDLFREWMNESNYTLTIAPCDAEKLR